MRRRIAKDLSPFREAAVRSEDHGALLIASVDELEEQIAAAAHDRQVADLIDDQQRCATEIADALTQRSVLSALASEEMMSASVEKATLRPALTA